MDSSSATWTVVQVYNNGTGNWLFIDQNWNWIALNISNTWWGSSLRIGWIPTSATGLSSWDVWSNGGVLNIVA